MIRYVVLAIALWASTSLSPPAWAQEGSGDFDCLMDPAVVVEVAASATGVLSEIMVGRGDVVEAGQVVAVLDSTIEDATVDLLRTRAVATDVIDVQREQLDMMVRRSERIRGLREQGLASEDALEQVEAERLASQSLLSQAETNQEIAIKELARAEAALSLRRIRSPTSGVVVERKASPGEYLGADDYVIRVVQHDPIFVETFLPVELYGTVAVGDRAEVRPDAPIGGVYDAQVTVVDSVFDAASGTFGVRLELPNADGALPAGHRCRLSFPRG